MKIPFRPLLAGALLIGPFLTAIPAFSQAQNQEQPNIAIRESKVYEIPVKNVAPHLLAWWLDPVNQPTPPEFGMPLPQQPAPKAREGAFALPAGIESIVPVDAQKVLLVRGTAEAVEKLGNIVAFLDQPLREVEVEIHVVPLTPEELKTVGLAPTQPPSGATTPATESVRIGFSRPNNNLANLLATRLQTGPLAEAKLPRVLALNNLSAELTASRSYPVPADIQDKLATLVPQSPAGAPLELQTPLKINFTPTINNDNTVSVLMDLKGQVQLGHTGDTNGLALGNPSALTTIANVRDGDTIAIRGFDRNFTSAFLGTSAPTKVPMLGDIPLINNDGAKVPMLGDIPTIGKLFRNKASSSAELVVFLTPRIVHRIHP